jgi:hypothetical protein
MSGWINLWPTINEPVSTTTARLPTTWLDEWNQRSSLIMIALSVVGVYILFSVIVALYEPLKKVMIQLITWFIGGTMIYLGWTITSILLPHDTIKRWLTPSPLP